MIVDDQTLAEHVKVLQESNNFTNQNKSRQGSNHEIYDNVEKRPPMLTQQVRRGQTTNGFQRTPSSVSNPQLFLTQQQHQLYQQTEEIIMLKN